MLKDQLDLLSVFNAHNVDYLVVGGHAVNAYTQPRFTKDLDVFVRASESNAAAVFKALAEYGAPLGSMSPAEFAGGAGQYFQVGVEPHRVDILQSIDGVTFDEAWPQATPGLIDGVHVRFISREHLILNKLASGRNRDLGDVDELRKFAENK